MEGEGVKSVITLGSGLMQVTEGIKAPSPVQYLISELTFDLP